MAAKIQEKLVEGAQTGVHILKKQAPSKDISVDNISPRDGNSTIQTQSTNVDFFQHFEILEMVTTKCIKTVCFKLRSRKFMLK